MRQPRLRGDIEGIMHAARRAADLTRQLLAFSRRQVVKPEVIDLNDIVQSLVHMLSRVLGQHVRLETSVTSAPALVWADGGALELALLNLTVNARDAMPAGGVLTVTTTVRTLDATSREAHCGARPGRYCCVSVRDTGTGIQADVLEHIFEPFFTTKGIGQGTGLGLASVYGTVKQFEGYVDVQTELGVGTVFDVYLPEALARPPQMESHAMPGTKP